MKTHIPVAFCVIHSVITRLYFYHKMMCSFVQECPPFIYDEIKPTDLQLQVQLSGKNNDDSISGDISKKLNL